MMKSNNYLSRSLIQADKDRRSVAHILGYINKIRKNPLFLFVLFTFVLMYTPILAKAGIVKSSFVTAIGTTVIYCIVALGFCLLLGYSALASLGTAGFIAIGAYSTYYCLAEWGLSIAMAFVIAIVGALVIGIVVGYISLRIEGIYLAIVTLGIAQIIKEVLSAICDIIKLKGSQIILFGNEAMKLKTNDIFYLLVVVLFLLMVVTHNLMNSPTGRAMLAMKNSTSAAQAFGISLMKYRLLAFTISIIYASVAGVLYMLYVRYECNSMGSLFTLTTSLNILGAVIIGGTKSIWGTIGGTFIIYGIEAMFLQDIEFFRTNSTLIILFSGLLIILVTMFYPGGLAQLVLEIKYKLKSMIKKLKEDKYGRDLG